MSSALAITLFVVGLVVAVMIHEWGHFVTARRFGMRADRFFLGFGPTVWSTRKGETEYGVKVLPLGGFVRIVGMSIGDDRMRSVSQDVLDAENVAKVREAFSAKWGTALEKVPAVPDAAWSQLRTELRERGTPEPIVDQVLAATHARVADDATAPEVAAALDAAIAEHVEDTGRVGDLHHRLLKGDAERFFHDRPAWERFIVLVAGAGTHFVVATVLLLVGFLFFPQPTGDVLPQVGQFVEDNVAEAAGFETDDRIVSVNGVPVQDFEQLVEIVGDNAGNEIVVEVQRDGERLALPVTPAPVEEDGETVGKLGFYPAIEFERLSPLEAVKTTFVGGRSITDMITGTFQALGRVFGPEGIGQIFSEVDGQTDRTGDGAVSLIGAGSITGTGVARYGGFFLLAMLAAVNVFVGIFNLLPLPPLDGGHVAVLGVERSVNAVRRRRGLSPDWKVDPRTIAAIAIPVIAFVGTISVALLWLDITNPISLN